MLARAASPDTRSRFSKKRIPMTLHDLLARVESATGADREIDAQVEALLRHKPGYDESHFIYRNFPTWEWRSDGAVEAGAIWDAQRYTASVDATIALQERVLPGWKWKLVSAGSGYAATMYKPTGLEVCFIGGRHTPALAHLSAIIRALIAKGESDVEAMA